MTAALCREDSPVYVETRDAFVSESGSEPPEPAETGEDMGEAAWASCSERLTENVQCSGMR